MVEVLKQNQYVPMTVEKQIAIIFAAGKGLLDDIDTSKIREFESAVLEYLEDSHKDLLSSIQKSGEVSDDSANKLEKGISDFKKGFKA